MRNRIIVSWTLVAALLATVLVVTSLGRSGEDTTQAADAAPANTPPTDTGPDTTTDPVVVDVVDEPSVEPDIPAPPVPPQPDQVSFAVDGSLQPEVPEIAPVNAGDAPRQTARLRSTGGVESDIVLGELTVSVRSDDALQAFLDRWNGTVVDTIEPDEGDEYTDHLVAVDPSTAPVEQLAGDLLAVEPHHDGEFAVSDELALSLMSIAAHETAYHGTEVALNWMTTSTGVVDGTSAEDPGREGNDDPTRRSDAFQWNWISSTAPQASGIDAAWQLMHQNVGTRVKMMIVDGGFVYNEDLPAQAKIRGGQWGVENPKQCSGGTDCPWHGTDVAMAAMARLNNGFGTAGPASYVADLIAVVPGGDNTYERYKSIRNVVKEERPHIVNMSFGSNITSLQGSAERIYGRWFRKVRDEYGALPFSSAGNDGIDVDSNDALTTPCELEGVVCVGGVDGDAKRHGNSNYGTKTGGGSVEIYGPHCVYALANHDVPGDSTTKTTCGTSVASPVVAGVAALVIAANPTLGPKQVWQIIKDTAHTDNLGSEVTGHHRRIDAYRAVATALGHTYTLPTLTIEAPTPDDEIGADDWVDLVATAENFAGMPLPIQWSRIGGELVNSVPTTDPVSLGELEPGRHTFIARATDVMGHTTTRTLEIEVANTPPRVSISSPAANTYRYTVEEVLLDGSTSDADDDWASLTDADVSWTVRREGNGEVVFQTTGHQSVIPANTLSVGDYEVVFRGIDPGGVAISDTALLTMLMVPPGESLPKPTIISPTTNEVYEIGSGAAVASVHLQASATDAEDGAIAGTRMRWVAEQGETRIVLCEGSELNEGGGGIAVVQDCSDVMVQLPSPPEAPTNPKWTLTVEVVDSAGLPGRLSRTVSVHANPA
ncbi:MAG: S8 family serine peptidase [Ilumatobacter sp.]|uniref:S8 family serine peptidase n=1 Tax=Ilumatobacter sp. TaxID=1967498 RepID=UPI0026318E0B|nr:S8 family serine peptidase [Ilumatobacter sp.]MDJ0770848.1 S8 family serine peptidase [Ilumatobacter sp.]